MYQENTMSAKAIKHDGEKGKRGRPRVPRPMKRVNISVDPADYEAIERLATANGMSSAMMKAFLESRNCGGVMAALRGKVS